MKKRKMERMRKIAGERTSEAGEGREPRGNVVVGAVVGVGAGAGAEAVDAGAAYRAARWFGDISDEDAPIFDSDHLSAGTLAAEIGERLDDAVDDAAVDAAADGPGTRGGEEKSGSEIERTDFAEEQLETQLRTRITPDDLCRR